MWYFYGNYRKTMGKLKKKIGKILETYPGNFSENYKFQKKNLRNFRDI